MKKLIIILLLFPILLSAQKKGNLEWAFFLIPDTLMESANQVIRLSEHKLEIKSPKTGLYTVKKAVTIFNEEAKGNVLSLYYNESSKVKKIHASIYDKTGNFIRKIDKEDVRDISAVGGNLYTDSRIKQVEIVQTNYPYTIVWEYEQLQSGAGFVAGSDWNIQGFYEGVQRSSFELSTPQDININFRAVGTEVDPVIAKIEGNTIYKWEVDGLKPKVREIFSPPVYEVLPAVFISLDNFQIDNYKGSFESWKTYGDFMYKLYEGRDELPQEVVTDIRNLVAGVSDPAEKVDLLYRYMQEKVRYVSVQLGIGGWQPFDAAYVANNNYGDCKALSNFMKAMLRKAGIESYPVITRRGDLIYKVKEDFVKHFFNHAILYVPEVDYWLECTSNYYPPNYIGSDNMSRTALLVTAEGGKLKSTPLINPADNKELITAQMTIKANGSATVNYKSDLHGTTHERFRRMANNQTTQKQKEWVLDVIPLANFDLTTFNIEAEKETPTAVFNFEGNVMKYASKAGKRMFIPLNKLSVYSYIPPKDEDRTLPIYHDRAFNETFKMQIDLPEGYTVESLPYENDVLESEFGKYEIIVKQEGQKVLITRKITYYPVEVAASKYNELRKFYKDVARREKAKLVAVEKKT